MNDDRLFNSISYLIQDDQGYSNLYCPKVESKPLSIFNIFNSINTIVNNLREKDINPISIEIYTGEIIQEELLFQMIYSNNSN
ncbi:MAG: hypothetical protein HeimC3_05420 [Candidatus Heimdallarchaeota archaeon LC_3]|nr:MAG: hypothetical protein HeimC3_05420 [Candidatus Heimdallarchaeota archaeon LC_3]